VLCCVGCVVLCCGVVWHGVVWCGVALCGVGVVWCVSGYFLGLTPF
jgi:hypothetical protein